MTDMPKHIWIYHKAEEYENPVTYMKPTGEASWDMPEDYTEYIRKDTVQGCDQAHDILRKWLDLAERCASENFPMPDANRMADFGQGIEETKQYLDSLPTPPQEE